MTVGFYCYLAGALSNGLLAWILLATSRGGHRGIWLVLASVAMAVWASALAIQEAENVFSPAWIWTFEAFHLLVWLVFFSKLLHQGKSERATVHPDRIRRGIWILSLLQVAYIWLSPQVGQDFGDSLRPSYHLFGHLGQAVVGLVLIEQFYRNSRVDQRWRIKFLCVAIGTLFVYDFYMYSDGLLGNAVREDLWVARGAIVALLPPLIGVSAARNPDWAVDIFVSRHVVFHSVTLLGSGSYLLIMATASYYLKLYGGEWGSVMQVVFMVASLLALLVVLFSGQIRAQVRVFLNKNFFNYAYDYRQEWLRLIATLSDRDSGLRLEERVVLALGEVVESPSGVLWGIGSHGNFGWRASYGDPDINLETLDGSDPICRLLASGFVVNLPEMTKRPDLYDELPYPAWLVPFPQAWLLVPLLGKRQRLDGIVLLTRARTEIGWNWEIIDMLKTTSRLCASYLALEDAAKELAEAQQFDGFNRLSAFVIHDLKNLIAQLSLVVRNADKHRDNPEFMRDAITTVAHAVERMNKLMSQLRNSSPTAQTEDVRLDELIAEVVESRRKQLPIPSYQRTRCRTLVAANRDRLASALEHVIHNAQDAAGKNGWVAVRLRVEGANAWVDVEDNGCGMDEDFVHNRLFKPFETTKGLTGMGIGAYESREFVRSMGGDLQVQSEPGRGSLFSFKIPLELSSQSDLVGAHSLG
ncbi:MAG: PEP-CTERM system histidine kinase PrsK [Methylococcaceae bacterium]|nr:PEP-CTERM system histidine kinase PrsK [Methylococcaceae bacterium]